MARKTKLETCVRCGEPAQLGVYAGLYLVRNHGPQFKQVWPARGYCGNCLLRLAKKRGVSKEKIDCLRRKLHSSAEKPGARRTA